MTTPIQKKKKVLKPADNYIRVGTDYFKIIERPDRFGIIRSEIAKWNKEEITLDEGKKTLYDIPKFDTFINEPNNNGVERHIYKCYNMYHQFPHKPKKGNWLWTFNLLKHIFGNQFKSGMIYMKVLYEYPKQILPILVLVSETRETGKSTFLDWLNMVFGENMVMIEPDVIGGTFNGEYAKANIIGIDETIIDKQIAVEKIKSLATKKYISVNSKFISQYKLPFFGKIILASNNEDRFIRIDDKEIRFWVRKIGVPKESNHNILNDMIAEIPAFLYYLTTMKEIDFTQSRMVLTEKQISNEYLLKVKEQSKSSLYHELTELFTDFFNQAPINHIEVIPSDIKNKWFSHNNNIPSNYIRKVLRDEFTFKQNNYKRYAPFGEGDTKPGTPFIIEKERFCEGEYIGETPLPF